MSVDEVAAVERHIAFHKSNAKRARSSGTANTALDPDELWVLSTIADFMFSVRADVTSMEMLRQSTDFPGMVQKVPPLMAFLNREKMDRVQRRMLLGIAFEILYEEKTRLGAACSSRVIMRELHRVPALIDSQFPGYARNGLLPFIVRAYSNRGHADED